jgi:hypothetical protein
MTHASRFRFATAGLWTLALDLVARLAPVLAGAVTLAPALWRSAARRLGDIEALARRLLLAEAAVLSKRMQAPNVAIRPARACSPRTDMGRPRLRFRVGLAAPVRVRRRETAETPPRPRAAATYETAPLQRRMAALDAVIADPAPHAMRLARRLARRRRSLPDILMKLRRVRLAHDAPRALSAAFREPFEHLVARCAPARAGRDPPRRSTDNAATENAQDARRRRTPA